MTGELTGRDRILTALDGGEPDRAGCALGFCHVDLHGPEVDGGTLDDVVDVDFVSIPVSEDEAALGRAAQPYPPDTRLGTPAQVTRYRRWHYRPHDGRRANPLARAQSLADLEAFPFPEVVPFADGDALAAQVRGLHARGLAAGGNLPHLGGELFEAAWRLRGLENFLIDLRRRPAWAHFLLDRLTELACRNARALAAAGIDVLALDDDVGMPGTMMNPTSPQRTSRPSSTRCSGTAE